jgi:hypothetical protein
MRMEYTQPCHVYKWHNIVHVLLSSWNTDLFNKESNFSKGTLQDNNFQPNLILIYGALWVKVNNADIELLNGEVDTSNHKPNA